MSSTDLTHFRNQFLTRAESTLLALDIANADRNTLIINAALLRGFDTVNQIAASLSTASAIIGSMTGSELDTYLAILDNIQWFSGVITDSVAMASVAGSSSAMAAIWASNIAADTVLTTSAARLAVYNSDTALTALQANPTQVARQIGISGRCVTATTSAYSFTFVANGTKVILLRRYYAGSEYDYLCWGRGKTTEDAAGGVTAGGRNLYTGETATGTQSGVYTSNSADPTTNDATANFVAAANGLRRVSFGTNKLMTVLYITV